MLTSDSSNEVQWHLVWGVLLSEVMSLTRFLFFILLLFVLLRGLSTLYLFDFVFGALCSGDVYTGQWAEHKKHGKGKFQWISGAMLASVCQFVISLCFCIEI